jgi:hypothetical protein
MRRRIETQITAGNQANKLTMFFNSSSVRSGICRPDGAGELGGAGGYKDFAPDGAAANCRWQGGRTRPPKKAARQRRPTNRNAVAAFSPALPDAVGLRWVNAQNKYNSEVVVAWLRRNREIRKICEWNSGLDFGVVRVVRG